VRVAPVVLRSPSRTFAIMASACPVRSAFDRSVLMAAAPRGWRDLSAWIERALGILKHQLHATAQLLRRCRRRIDRIDAVEDERAGGRLFDQGHGSAPGSIFRNPIRPRPPGSGPP